MAKGQAGNRNRQQNRKPNSQPTDSLAELFWGETEPQTQAYSPKTVKSLENSRRLIPVENRRNYGIPSERLESTPDKIKIVTRHDAEPIKYGEDTPGDLETKESLAERPLSIDDRGDTRYIHGRVAIETNPVLIINNTAIGFRGSNGRFTEDSHPLQGLPNESFVTRIADEFFLIGKDKKTGEKVILVPDTGSQQLNEQLARTAKGRIMESIKADLQDIVGGKGDASMVDVLSDQANSLARLYKVRSVKVKDAGKEFDEIAQNIETIIEGGKTETQMTKGIVRFDEEGRTLSITRPVILDLEDYDVEVLDATGANRQTILIEGPHSSQPPEINQIMRGLEGQQLVQKEAHGDVYLPAPLPVSTARNPYAVFPTIK